jgi:molecular chaperone DnaK
LEGEGSDPDDYVRIGRVVIEGLPANRPAHRPVTVTMFYDRDGILKVSARDEDSGKSVSTVVERAGGTATRGSDAAAEFVKTVTVR